MKLLMAAIFFLWTSALVGADHTQAASVAYEFVTVDIPTVSQIELLAPEDIDDDGTLLANTSGNGFDNVVRTIDPKTNRGKNRNVSFDCGDTCGRSDEQWQNHRLLHRWRVCPAKRRDACHPCCIRKQCHRLWYHKGWHGRRSILHAERSAQFWLHPARIHLAF